MTKPLVIGLSGKKGSGKDTTYKILSSLGASETTQVYVGRIAFADALKDEVAAAFGVSVEFIEDNKEKFRTLLQGWGEAKRWCFGMDYWIKKADVRLATSKMDVVVITDVRYENEAEWVKSLGGILVRVVAPTSQLDLHPSETALDNWKFDFSIFNSMSRDFEGVVELMWSAVILPKLNGSSRTNG